MRRITAVLLGAAALLGVLTTPAIAAPGDGTVETLAGSAVITVQNALTGAVVTITNVTGTL
ncbi:hypothetical protein AF335_09785 [Streptomyces eurocidicus]|uniref:Chaplin domain-containing protein n=1 Tax=Streptomyces eurocidicus TaxID=66423 RepID=A0A2N8NWR8_STREU|nr:hypothetical protein [Streptomyces eurocidicus]MBB5117985.1 hypothetical protein [Streptomyces eurocidicus]MBF6053964.1 hypothetical protein [Streptomyces eurocidicus]PNE33215.1 hypothetical protein AF335_09785 [Streptomyces eurocidicus]